MLTPTENHKIFTMVFYILMFLFTRLDGGSYTIKFIANLNELPNYQNPDFRYSGSHSKINVNDVFFETFQWKIAAYPENEIQVKLESVVWEELTNPYKTDLKILEPNIKIIEGMELGCPVKSVTFLPWRLNNGKIEYAIQFQIIISYPDEKITLQALHGEILNPENIILQSTNQTEYLILAPEIFESAALNLQSLHQNEIDAQYQLNTEISFISQILAEISSTENFLNGNNITNYLQMKISENPSLKYLLIFGDETHFPPNFLGEVPADDLYTWNENGYPQLATGRIPVATTIEAEIVVDKIRNYMLNPAPGIWRQKISLLADDHRHPTSSASTEFSHTSNTEELMEIIKDEALVETFYGSEYEPTPSSGWINLPQMTADVVQVVNSGTALLNYIGHGSPKTLSHEQIIDMDRDMSIINPEQGKETIWIVGTCSFGHYDNENAMSEALLKKQSGAIGLITTTRSVNVPTNDNFLERIFHLLSQYMKNENNYRLGEIFYHTKSFFQSSNYMVFHLFGDPALILPFPVINNLLEVPDSSEFSQMTEHFIPTVNTTGTNPIITINGPEWTNEIYLDDFNTIQKTITHPGNIFYQGMLNESSTIFLPVDIPQCSHCLDLKLYAQTALHSGSYDISRNGSLFDNPEFAQDSTGPQIYILKNNRTLVNGSVIYKPAEIQISFTDKSGINLSGGIGHGLLLKINEEHEHDLSQLFYMISGDTGRVDFAFPEFMTGTQRITIYAWDNANNNTTLENTFHFLDAEKFQLTHVFPYPNPFQNDVEFTFQLSEPADVQIHVFSLAGDGLMKITDSDVGPGFVRIPWDGRDKWNRLLSNGTFIFTVFAKNMSGEERTVLQKMTKVE